MFSSFVALIISSSGQDIFKCPAERKAVAVSGNHSTVSKLKIQAIITLFLTLSFGNCVSAQTNKLVETIRTDHVERLEMHLSAFGVESDDYPSIDIYVDFLKDSSNCHKWYYNPKYKDSTYHLTSIEMQKVLSLLENLELDKLTTDYKSVMSDQPTSSTEIYLKQQKFKITDYGLQGEEPLKSLYLLVYKL